MTAKEIREMMDNIARAHELGNTKPGSEMRMAAMMLGEIAAQLDDIRQALGDLYVTVAK